MTPLPDGVLPQDIPGNRPQDEAVEEVWSNWWDEWQTAVDWLGHYLHQKGFTPYADAVHDASTVEELEKALREARDISMEYEFMAAHDEAVTLLENLPPSDPGDAMAKLEDEAAGV